MSSGLLAFETSGKTVIDPDENPVCHLQVNRLQHSNMRHPEEKPPATCPRTSAKRNIKSPQVIKSEAPEPPRNNYRIIIPVQSM